VPDSQNLKWTTTPHRVTRPERTSDHTLVSRSRCLPQSRVCVNKAALKQKEYVQHLHTIIAF